MIPYTPFYSIHYANGGEAQINFLQRNRGQQGSNEEMFEEKSISVSLERQYNENEMARKTAECLPIEKILTCLLLLFVRSFFSHSADQGESATADSWKNLLQQIS
jgi:hypothetical protein